MWILVRDNEFGEVVVYSYLGFRTLKQAKQAIREIKYGHYTIYPFKIDVSSMKQYRNMTKIA